ncbi:hypothetical protein [Corynebacterium stationis]|uniref:hypothetical protein n=1 Tax=Corynebacterium stationis TaxID=1705 RepID=UPI00076F7B1E|nr:hypothetical protein [Corynebacterium stationis]AMJ43686.1 hypothetical protein AW169_01240 [Corynebacterium stationis]AQX70133.1 hypothetical protein CA21670_00365 [Corynebacterium stationis]ASJ17837.1 hypothetical protein BA700_01240 [Corynebacterium stationis]HJG64031.1 hypothetical protein [Corynebacterium stationis]
MAKSKSGFTFAPDDFDELMKIVQPQVDEAGEAVHKAVTARVPGDVPVTSTSQIGDNGRPVSLVTIAHASGLARQAKSGVLSRAAAEVGLEVTRYEER